MSTISVNATTLDMEPEVEDLPPERRLYFPDSGLTIELCNFSMEALNKSCQMPFTLLETMVYEPITQPILGYLQPALGFFTFITNLFICAVLLRPHMWSPTNFLLTAMAIADLLTGSFPQVPLLYFYAGYNYRDWVPYGSCRLYRILYEYLPTICHTASIWLTVTLALQRFIATRQAAPGTQRCNNKVVIVTIVILYMLAVIFHLCRFFEEDIVEVIAPSLVYPNTTVRTCVKFDSEFVQRHTPTYQTWYWILRIICIHVIPCLMLVVLTSFLIMTLRKAQIRKRLLLQQNRRHECRRLTEHSGTTFMLIVVVTVFLIVEVPLAVFFILYIVNNNADQRLVDPQIFSLAGVIINTMIMLSYPMNFFIYCAMSRQFRQTAKQVLVGCCKKSTTPREVPQRRTELQSQYLSLANGNRGNTTETAF